MKTIAISNNKGGIKGMDMEKECIVSKPVIKAERCKKYLKFLDKSFIDEYVSDERELNLLIDFYQSVLNTARKALNEDK